MYVLKYINAEHTLNVNKNNNIILFKPLKQPFYINKARYRESINSFFVLNFKPGTYTVSEKPYSQFSGSISYGNKLLKNTILKNNKWTMIDTVNFKLIKKNTVNILSTISLNYKHSDVVYKLIHNNEIIEISDNLNKLFTKIYDKGYHTITLLGKSNDVVCVCPTFEDGYLNSYQLAVWWSKPENNNENKTIHIKNKEILQNIIILNSTKNISDNNNYTTVSVIESKNINLPLPSKLNFVNYFNFDKIVNIF